MAASDDNKIALIVEDSASMRLIARRVLESLHFTVYEAVDGQAALDLLADEEEPPDRVDLFMVDWHMEPMDGCAFVAAMREDPRFRKSRVLMVTVESDRERIRQAAQTGINGYLLKPYSKAVLIDKIQGFGLIANGTD